MDKRAPLSGAQGIDQPKEIEMHVIIEVFLAAFHMGEKQRQTGLSGAPVFLKWFNRLWGYEAWDDFPLSEGRNLWINTIGGFTLVTLAIIGHHWWSPAEAIFLSFVGINSTTNLVLSTLYWTRLRTKMASPGWVTSLGFLGLVAWRWEIIEAYPWWTTLGAGFVALMYAEAGIRVWHRHRKEFRERELEEAVTAARAEHQELMEEFRRGHSKSADRDMVCPSGTHRMHHDPRH